MEKISYYRLADFIKALHPKAKVITSYGVFDAEVSKPSPDAPVPPVQKIQVVISDFVYFRENIKHIIHFEDALGEKETEEYKKMKIKAEYMFRAIRDFLTSHGFFVIPASTKEEVNGMIDVKEIADSCTKMIMSVIEQAKKATEAKSKTTPENVVQFPAKVFPENGVAAEVASESEVPAVASVAETEKNEE